MAKSNLELIRTDATEAPEAQRSLDAMEESYLLCRVRHNHAMHVAGLDDGMLGQRIEWRCGDCGMTRYDTVNHRGDVIVRSYVQPPGYKWLGERLESGDLRMELLRRHGATGAQRNLARRGKR
jgi:hypothetical protein